jgi:hypothetical protein
LTDVIGNLEAVNRTGMKEMTRFRFDASSGRLLARRDGPTRRVYPGALYRAEEFTVAVLDLETDDLRILAVSR